MVKIKLGSLLNFESIESTIEAVGETVEFAELIREDKENFGPSSMIGQAADNILRISKNAEIGLITEGIEAILPPLKVASALCRYIAKKNSPDTSTFMKCVVLICFEAYIKSVYEHAETISPSRKETKHITSKSIKDVEITEYQAKQALSVFPQSDLSRSFRDIVEVRLSQIGFSNNECQIILAKALWSTAPKIIDIWGDLPEAVRRFDTDSISQFEDRQRKLEGIEEYLRLTAEEYDKSKPLLQNSQIRLSQLYVQLEIKKILPDGNTDINENAINIHSWVDSLLLSNERGKLILVEGSSGQGKTAFCKMLFISIKERLHPAFTPVLINLRDINRIEETLLDTLRPCLQAEPFFPENSSFSPQNNWLINKERRFLVLLDGLDELLPSSGFVGDFISQVIAFQGKNHHQFLITGRSLYSDYFNQSSFYSELVVGGRIQLMNRGIRNKWIDQWAKAVYSERINSLSNEFQDFIESCPEDIEKKLAGEPLFLGLLAQLFQTNEVSSQDFSGLGSTSVRIKIYQKVLDVAVERTFKNRKVKRLEDSNELHHVHVTELLIKISIAYIHAGYKPVPLLETTRSLNKDNPIFNLIEDGSNGIKLLKNLVPTFYTRLIQSDRKPFIEFTHRSFSEYLFAREVKEILIEWMDCTLFEEIANKLYFVVGYRQLSTQIVDYVTSDLIVDIDTESIKKLLSKLQQFYRQWAGGFSLQEYIARQIQPNRNSKGIHNTNVSFRQIDAYVGFNSLIVLLSFQRRIKSNRLLSNMPPRNCSTPPKRVLQKGRKVLS